MPNSDGDGGPETNRIPVYKMLASVGLKQLVSSNISGRTYVVLLTYVGDGDGGDDGGGDGDGGDDADDGGDDDDEDQRPTTDDDDGDGDGDRDGGRSETPPTSLKSPRHKMDSFLFSGPGQLPRAGI